MEVDLHFLKHFISKITPSIQLKQTLYYQPHILIADNT